MLRRTARITAWIVGSLLGLIVTAYLVLVAINLRDRAPSEEAIRFADAYRNRPAVADSDNAYVYLMSFKDHPYDRNARPQVIRSFIEACRPGGADCADAFSTGGEVLELWMASEGSLLERYRTFIAHAGWKETVPFDVRDPIPGYGLVMDGQRLYLLNAMAHARKKDHSTVRRLLTEDVRFWRNVLKSSDTLISRMIATAALNRHFELGNLILREFPRTGASKAIPAEWGEPISDAERSFHRCLAGEWLFASASMGNPPSDPEASLLDRATARALRPLYQPQDSINDLASYYSQVAAILDAPVLGYEAAADRATELDERRQDDALESLSPYNLVRHLVVSSASADFGPYARRVNDIEGVRRAALAAMKLRELKVPADGVFAALKSVRYRNPYTDQPFDWDAKARAIVFMGLESGVRGEHQLKY